jgi:two-component system response regulator YesN
MDLNKVLVVDDEKIIRDGLHDYVKWEDQGLCLLGCAENGVEALEIIKQNDIDILITDIRMPNMDGLELIRNLVGLGKCPVAILISGYNDFAYAQQAIKLKIVFDYLLKPIDLKELEQTLQMAVKERERLSFIATIDKLADIKEYMDNIIKESCWRMASDKKTPMPAIIRTAIGMIEKHYADPDFTLKWVAEQTMVTPNYLSTQFKEEVGIGFVRYLNGVRIDKAKELLKNTFLKIYEISYRIGIEDVHYFARLFGEYTGLTPKEYRRGMKKNG